MNRPDAQNRVATATFTHRGSLCGIPCYIGNLNDIAPVLMGTNFVFDWMLEWWPGLIVRVTDWVAYILVIAGLMSLDAYSGPVWVLNVKDELETPFEA